VKSSLPGRDPNSPVLNPLPAGILTFNWLYNISETTKIMKKKTILLIVLGILLMVSLINFITGTSITVNGKQVTSLSGHLAAYFGLIILVVVMAILIPSVYILAVVMVITFFAFGILFFPLLPMMPLLLPAIVLAGIVFIVYKLVKRKRQ